MTGWISLAYALVTFANYIFERNRTAALEKVGEDRERLRQFQAMEAVSSTLRDVDNRFDKMTDAEVRDEIAKNGDWRD